MTRQESGRRGGLATLAKYGTDHFRQLAHELIEKRGNGYMAQIGYKGGQAYVRKYVAHPR